MKDNRLNAQGIDESTFLDNYDMTAYEQPSVTVDILLLTVDEIKSENIRKLPEKMLKILLIRRKEHPYIGQWAIPGGFVRLKESLEQAAYRELYEETGVDNIYLEQLYTFGATNRDPRGRVISSAYMSLVDMNQISTKAGTDAADAKWFDIHYNVVNHIVKSEGKRSVETKEIEIELKHKNIRLKAVVEVVKIVSGKHVTFERKLLSSNRLAFDHGVIIQTGLERLRSKVNQSDIVFQLMPELFTLTELQKTYEVILGHPLSKANFRRKIAKYVEETDKIVHSKGHRPSKLFKYKPYREE